MKSNRAIVAAACGLSIVASAGSALANPRPLPFTYPYETLAKGELELEQYIDMTPVKALSTSTGEAAWLERYLFQTELEYGITDRLELGLYVQLAPNPSDAFAGAATLGGGNAIKQRLRLRLAEAGEWPVDVSVYGEVVEAEKEIELEAKVNLQRRFGLIRIMSNLSAEHEFYFDGEREWVLNPTLGITAQVTPWLHTGVESWMKMEIPTEEEEEEEGEDAFGRGPHVYVGPTVMLAMDRLWWSNGVYFRATDAARRVEPGDAYGRIWVRSVIGFNL